MARLFYQPVGLPSGGGSASAVASAASSVGAGFDRIGTGLTNLGLRREQRFQARQAQQQSQALEGLKLLTQNAGSEEDLGALTRELIGLGSGEGAGFVPGASDAIGSRRGNIIANNTIRENNRRTQVGNDAAQLENTLAQRADDAQREYGTQITELNRLSDLNDPRALENREALLGEISAKYGADIASAVITNSRNLQASGDQVRTGIESNALDILGIRQDQSIQASEAADANRARDFTFDNAVVDRNRSDQAFNRGETVAEAVAAIKTEAFSREDALRLVDESALDPRVKEQVSQQLAVDFDANSALLDTTNPVDPLTPIDDIFNSTDRTARDVENAFAAIGIEGEIPTVTDIDPTVVSAGIQESVRQAQRVRPSLGIFNEANAIEEEFGDSAGNIGDLATTIANRYESTSLPDKWQNRLERTQRRHNLSDAEVVAIADRSFKARGANFLGVNVLVPGGQRADERILDVDEFDRLAKDYSKNNRSNLRADATRLNESASRARTLETQIPNLIRARQRAIETGGSRGDREKERLDQQITAAYQELSALEQRTSGILGQ